VVLLTSREMPSGLREPALDRRIAQGSTPAPAAESPAQPGAAADREAFRAPAPSAAAEAPRKERDAAARLGDADQQARSQKGADRARQEAGQEATSRVQVEERSRALQEQVQTSPAPQAPGLASPQAAYQVRNDDRGEATPIGRPQAPGFAAAPPQSKDLQAEGVESQIQKRKASPLQKVQANEAKLDKESSVTKSTGAAEPEVAATLVGPAKQAGTKPSEKAEALTASPAEREAPRPTGAMLEATAATEAQLCGRVFDPSGRPLAGAQVSLPTLGRSVAADATGRFCMASPPGDQTVSVMAIGFKPHQQQVVVGGGTSELRVALEPVATLGDGVLLRAAGPADSLHLRGGRADEYRFDSVDRAAVPVPALNARGLLADSLRKAVARAESEGAKARAARSPALYEAAAAQWQRALPLAIGTSQERVVRYHLAETRYLAWQTSPSPKRASAAAEALTSYLVRAPMGAQRDSAARWLDRLKH
jgi:hypothetical protein